MGIYAGYHHQQGDFDPGDADDIGNFITCDGKCYGCGYQFDVEEEMGLFVVEESGVQPGTQYGPAVHWARGYLVCPGCKEHLPYETSSD